MLQSLFFVKCSYHFYENPGEVRWFNSAAVKWGFFMRPPLEEVEGAADEASKMEEVATWRNQKRNIWCFCWFLIPIL